MHQKIKFYFFNVLRLCLTKLHMITKTEKNKKKLNKMSLSDSNTICVSNIGKDDLIKLLNDYEITYYGKNGSIEINKIFKVVYSGNLSGENHDEIPLIHFLLDLKQRYPDNIYFVSGKADLFKMGLHLELNSNIIDSVYTSNSYGINSFMSKFIKKVGISKKDTMYQKLDKILSKICGNPNALKNRGIFLGTTDEEEIFNSYIEIIFPQYEKEEGNNIGILHEYLRLADYEYINFNVKTQDKKIYTDFTELELKSNHMGNLPAVSFFHCVSHLDSIISNRQDDQDFYIDFEKENPHESNEKIFEISEDTYKMLVDFDSFENIVENITNNENIVLMHAEPSEYTIISSGRKVPDLPTLKDYYNGKKIYYYVNLKTTCFLVETNDTFNAIVIDYNDKTCDFEKSIFLEKYETANVRGTIQILIYENENFFYYVSWDGNKMNFKHVKNKFTDSVKISTIERIQNNKSPKRIKHVKKINTGRSLPDNTGRIQKDFNITSTRNIKSPPRVSSNKSPGRTRKGLNRDDPKFIGSPNETSIFDV